MQGRLTQAEADLDYAQLALTAGTAAVGRQRDSVAGLISDIYTAGDPELLAFSALLDAQTPEDLIRQDSVRDVIVGRETRAYDDLSAAEVLLDVREGEVQDAKREVAAKARDAAAHVVVMQGLEAQAQADKDEVVRLVADRKAANTEAKAAKQADRKKLKKLRKEDARIKHLLAERARKARLRALRQGQSTAPGNSGGFLNRPVPGPVTSSYGMRVHPIFGYYGLHDGTDFAGACGSPMYAPADGRVIQAYYQTAYGNRIVIDHGFQRGRRAGDDLQPRHALRRRGRRPGFSRPGGGLHGVHRLVDGLPPALHGDGERQPGRSDELALTALRAPGRLFRCRRRRVRRWSRRTRRRATTTTSRTPGRPAWSWSAPR